MRLRFEIPRRGRSVPPPRSLGRSEALAGVIDDLVPHGQGLLSRGLSAPVPPMAACTFATSSVSSISRGTNVKHHPRQDTCAVLAV